MGQSGKTILQRANDHVIKHAGVPLLILPQRGSLLAAFLPFGYSPNLFQITNMATGLAADGGLESSIVVESP